MTSDELRKSILQDAVRGALCKQNPEDEPASALLARIKKEKKRLVQEKKIKPPKNPSEIFRGDDGRFYEKSNGTQTDITDDLPFDIPDTWEWVRLGNLITINSGTSYKKQDVTTKGIRILRGGNIQNNEVVLRDDDVFLSELYEDVSKNICKGDVIIVASTGSKAVIGKPAFIEKEYPLTQIGAFLRIIRPIDINLADYMNIIFQSEYYRKHIRDSVKGTNINNIKAEYIEDLFIPLPPLAEQQRIAATLEKLQPLLAEYQTIETEETARRKALPDLLKKSILQTAVRGALLPQEETDEPASALLARIRKEKQRLIKEGKRKQEKNPSEITRGDDGRFYEKKSGQQTDITDTLPFDIPDTWEWVRLGELVYNHGQKKPEKDFCYIDIGTIDNKKQRLSNKETIVAPDKAASRARKIVQKGDILYSTVRPYLHNMCIVDKDFPKEPIASTGFAVLACHADYLNQFLFYYLLSPVFDAYANATENAKGVVYPAINDERLYKAFIPVPPLAEQRRIVHRLDQILSLLASLHFPIEMPHCKQSTVAAMKEGKRISRDLTVHGYESMDDLKKALNE